MSDTKDIQAKLLEPFDPMDIEWRIQQSGLSKGKKWAMVLAYVTNRAIMERLDDVFGIEGWQNEYQFMPDGGVVCGLKCRVMLTGSTVATYQGKPVKSDTSYEWITKYDGADKTAIEATKGGLSNAMKRAGVQWGIGRYLYRLDTTFVTLIEGSGATEDDITVYVKEFNGDKSLGGRHHFKRPKLPGFAIPKE